MPFKKNYGYWTDNNLKLEDFQRIFTVEGLDQRIFEKVWEDLILA